MKEVNPNQPLASQHRLLLKVHPHQAVHTPALRQWQVRRPAVAVAEHFQPEGPPWSPAQTLAQVQPELVLLSALVQDQLLVVQMAGRQ